MDRMRESDWKKFSVLQEMVLDRFCQKVLVDVQQVLSDVSKSSHVRYGEVYRLIQTRNKVMADIFDGMSRSVAPLRLLHMRRVRLIDDAEMSQFSEELQRFIRNVLSMR